MFVSCPSHVFEIIMCGFGNIVSPEHQDECQGNKRLFLDQWAECLWFCIAGFIMFHFYTEIKRARDFCLHEKRAFLSLLYQPIICLLC